ncbi:hypothetical protein EEL51_05405 [Muribaculaceae bacterium Isolate-110 (HZI)]|nr:hypothetical protein EEL51_05405 [Muribaculaceae bacterium Isolate-110 (HZI)]
MNKWLSFLLALVPFVCYSGNLQESEILTSSEQEFITMNARKVQSDIRDKFERLHEEWYNASRNNPHILLSSSIYTRMELPQFKEILDMGREIIPLILEKMMDRKYFFSLTIYEALMEKQSLPVNIKETANDSEQDRAQNLVREWIELYGKQ